MARLITEPFSGYYHREVPEHERELTEVGPGTPCGEYLRRFWQPVGMTSELKDLPKRIRIMGEDLVLFRDGRGKIGLLELHCSHRGTSLEFGIVERCGIRCCYHGWLYDVDGRVLETPGEPPESTFKERFFHGAYPAFEAEDLDPLLLGVGLEELGDALPVRGLVVDDVRGLHLHRPEGELRSHHALDVVAAADAVDVLVPAVGDGGVRIRRRDHREVDFLVDLGGRDGDTRVEVPDHGQDVLVGDDVLRVGHADVGLGLVVERYQFDLEAHLLEVALELLDGELRAELDALAEGGLAAAQRALRGDLDGALALGLQVGGRRQGHHGEGGQQNEGETDRIATHRDPSLVVESAVVGGRHYSGRPRVVKSRAARIAARNRRVAAAGSAAPQTAETTAAPSAPARITSPTLSGVMPPMPISGREVSGLIRRSSSGPTS